MAVAEHAEIERRTVHGPERFDGVASNVSVEAVYATIVEKRSPGWPFHDTAQSVSDIEKCHGQFSLRRSSRMRRDQEQSRDCGRQREAFFRNAEGLSPHERNDDQNERNEK